MSANHKVGIRYIISRLKQYGKELEKPEGGGGDGKGREKSWKVLLFHFIGKETQERKGKAKLNNLPKISWQTRVKTQR